MKILVPCKRVPDADQLLTVHSDGKRIITEHLPHLLNPFDAIAVEEALRIREEHDTGRKSWQSLSALQSARMNSARHWRWGLTGHSGLMVP